MKQVLFVLLAASLAANVGLGLRAWRQAPNAVGAGAPGSSSALATAQSAAAPAAPAIARNAPAAGTASAPAAALPRWRPTGSEADMKQVIAELRAAGFPPAILRAVVQQMLNDRSAHLRPEANLPFWKQPNSSPETVAARNALNKENRELMETLLGPDGRPSAMMDEASRLRRFGSLGDDKVDAIVRIERDYSEMTMEAFARRRGKTAAGSGNSLQDLQLLGTEKMADLAAVLSPDELAQYEMRTSRSAMSLMNGLRNVDVSEQEYAQLYHLQKSFDAANPSRQTMTPAIAAQYQADRLALSEQMRTVLGESRFYDYVEAADPMYAMATRALKDFPAVTPAKAYAAYQLQMELQSVMSKLITPGGGMSADRGAQVRATVEAYNTQLEQLIGTDAAAAYRKQGPGLIFGAGRQMAAPAARTTP